MKIGNKKISWNKNIVTISLCALFLVIIGGVSYAYFTASIFGNDTAKDVQAYAGTMHLVYDGTFTTSAENMVPGQSHEIKFTVENVGTLSTSYQIDMIDVINDFAKPEELVYTLSSTNGGAIQEETVVPQENETIIPAAGIDPGVTQEYTLTIIFKETGSPQNYNQGKTFGGKIQINSLDNTNYLAGRTMARAFNTAQVDFTYGDPQHVYTIKDVGTESSPSGITNLETPLSGSWTKYIGEGYEFDNNTGVFQLTNQENDRPYTKDDIGKYTVSSLDRELTLYKIEDVDDSVLENNNYFYDTTNYNTEDYYRYYDEVIEVGTAFDFDEHIGRFTLKNKETANLENNYEGYYACVGSCSTNPLLIKINKITDDMITDYDELSAELYYKERIAKDSNVTVASDNNKVVGTSYSFNNKTGYYTINNAVDNVTYNESYINYYTCSTNTSPCRVMYKIIQLDGSKMVKADTYRVTRTTLYTRVTKARVYTSEISKLTGNNGMFSAPDNNGMSYYFRGNVENNYVSFANQLWRILRINGNGTIRLVLSDTSTTKQIAFNNTRSHQYVGYTYNNESNCTKSSPCISEYNSETKKFVNNKTVTNSTIKNYLENTWYQNIAAYDDKIALGEYCNDTSSYTPEFSTTNIWYSPNYRSRNKTPDLSCPDTDKNYGGYYLSKVGLLTVDETDFAGYKYINSISPILENNYLYNGYNFWLMSPTTSSDTDAESYYAAKSNTSYGYASDTKGYARPVINLKADTVIASGDGTKDNPYVIN